MYWTFVKDYRFIIICLVRDLQKMDRYSISVFKQDGNCETIMISNLRSILFVYLYTWLKSNNRKDYVYGYAKSEGFPYAK
jgi:hypothetical protein